MSFDYKNKVHRAHLITALADVESSGFANNYPNLEPSYLPKGYRCTIEGRIVVGTAINHNDIVRQRWNNLPKEHQLSSACSWGPWQILYHTACDRGYKGLPYLLHDGLESGKWVEAHLDHLYGRGCRTVRDFADAWNSGNHMDQRRVPDYTDKVEAAYAKRSDT